jgi:hypothetical protein
MLEQPTTLRATVAGEVADSATLDAVRRMPRRLFGDFMVTEIHTDNGRGAATFIGKLVPVAKLHGKRNRLWPAVR